MRRSLLVILLTALVVLPGCRRKGGRGPYVGPGPAPAQLR